MIIYKLMYESEWKDLCTTGSSLGSPLDQSDGYIHCSTVDQVRETAEKYFTPPPPPSSYTPSSSLTSISSLLYVLALDCDQLNKKTNNNNHDEVTSAYYDDVVRWEPSRHGLLFPHLYRALYKTDVVWAAVVPYVNGKHQFPSEMFEKLEPTL
jgi:uncharacterized protein (DUF952 family)